jgi:hypothetical protein
MNRMSHAGVTPGCVPSSQLPRGQETLRFTTFGVFVSRCGASDPSAGTTWTCDCMRPRWSR